MQPPPPPPPRNTHTHTHTHQDKDSMKEDQGRGIKLFCTASNWAVDILRHGSW